MKNKKGFTLTELLAVLVILALLMTLAFPNFSDLTSKAKSNYDRSTQVLIKSAARMYVNNNINDVEKQIANRSDNKTCIPIGKLIAYEYLDSEIKNSDHSNIDGRNCVVVTKTIQNGSTKYSYEVSSTQKASNYGITDYLPPVITITGTNCKSVMNISSIDDYNRCVVSVSDDKQSGTKTFQNLKIKETDSSLSKTIVQEGNKIFISYNAIDSSGNKAIPLQVQLTLPE